MRAGVNIMKNRDGKTCSGNLCYVCGKIDSNMVILKRCDRCNHYYFCDANCQRTHWLAGHAGE